MRRGSSCSTYNRAATFFQELHVGLVVAPHFAVPPLNVYARLENLDDDATTIRPPAVVDLGVALELFGPHYSLLGVPSSRSGATNWSSASTRSMISRASMAAS